MSHTLTLEEIVRHPEITNVIVKYEPRRSGAAFVALERGGPISIAYEVYGNGPIHLVFIMGLNGPRIAWHRQVKYFGIDRGDQFTVLVFDNRGVGDSDAPWALKYSTSDMAKDTMELCDFLSWTKPKQLHVIGVSMGGMIAQELAYLIPDRIASLILQSTAAALVPTLPWHKHLIHRATMLMPKTLPQRLAAAQRNLFSPGWLVKPDDHGVFPTNADRYVAEELWRLNDLKPPVIQGFLLQGLAATWHYVGPERLKIIGEKVDRIMVCTGTADEMIEWGHSTRLVEGLRKGGNEVHYREWLGVGHVLSWEVEAEYNKMVEEFVTGAHRI
ncbi:Alpha/Beta hydrolase protein [Pyronema omphalodes]|nr:Alpha/Beta hydrolase protein [Pyronema omphalodes]